VPKAALAESLDDIALLGVYSALPEVLPYRVPEGQIMESFADEELAPLAPWAVQDGEYEGSLFLLSAARLKQLVADFDLDELKQQAAEFRREWFSLDDPRGASLEEWAETRRSLDTIDLSRFEDSFVELHHLLAMAELNGLTLALFFYSD
jgi:hypothetical protein